MCNHDGLDWEDIGLAGSLAEEMAEEERERERIRKEMEDEQEKDEKEKIAIWLVIAGTAFDRTTITTKDDAWMFDGPAIPSRPATSPRSA